MLNQCYLKITYEEKEVGKYIKRTLYITKATKCKSNKTCCNNLNKYQQCDYLNYRHSHEPQELPAILVMLFCHPNCLFVVFFNIFIITYLQQKEQIIIIISINRKAIKQNYSLLYLKASHHNQQVIHLNGLSQLVYCFFTPRKPFSKNFPFQIRRLSIKT